ncbi:MAG: hypothetical protein IH798_02405 [Gemmatimonadetes bacterium]|nr:hypothetical protein [Gemmatimonadota bacterium]
MKHIILVVVGVVSIQASANAQTAAETIERALAAAPRRAREGAAVIKWNADYTYETLKEGTNRLVCYNRSDERNRRPFAVVCTSVGNLDRAAQNRRFRAESADAAEERAMVAAAEENGTRVLPEYGSVWIHMDGRDRASARIHTTIAVPGATTESTGLPDNRSAGGAYIMAAGTSAAHIMIPGR